MASENGVTVWTAPAAAGMPSIAHDASLAALAGKPQGPLRWLPLAAQLNLAPLV